MSYSQKHNQANGENNRDGDNHNVSCNYGVEGPTDNTEIEILRHRQCKNMLATLFLSLGTPMISMGDEVRRTQQGNNNAYCQNNEISWFDWRLVDKHADLLRFVKLLSQFRHAEPTIEKNMHLSLSSALENVDICWHGLKPHQPDWSEHSHSLALTVNHPITKDELFLIQVAEVRYANSNNVTSLRRELDRTRRGYERLFTSVPCFICVLSRDHEILEANELYREEFGATDRSLCYEVCKGRTSKCPDCLVDQTFEDGEVSSLE